MTDKNESISKKRRGDFRTVFETEAGEAVLRDLLQYAGMFEVVPPTPNAPTERLMFHEGKRDVAIYILSQLNRRLDNAEAMLSHSKPPYEPNLTENEDHG